MLTKNQLIEQFSIYKNKVAGLDDCLSISDFPMLEKKEIISSFPAAWKNKTLESAIKNNVLELMTTSGSSGNKMSIFRKKDWWSKEYQRISRYHPLLNELYNHNKKKATLTTAICSNTVCFRNNPTVLQRTNGNTLHLNYIEDISTLSKAEVERIVEEYNALMPYNLDADPIYLAILITLMTHYKISTRLTSPAFISFCYEYCPLNCYRLISEYFVNVPIMQMYGSTELGYLYYRVSNSAYRLFPEGVTVKFKPVPQNSNVYELVVTSMKNIYMPLVNYVTGDLVEIDPEDRKYVQDQPKKVKLKRILGRKGDAFYSNKTGDFVTVADVDEVVSGLTKSILYFKLHLHPSSSIFEYVTRNGQRISEREEIQLMDQIQKLASCAPVTVYHRISIPPMSSGKYALIERST